MMDISLWGLVGAIAGTILAAAIYGTLIDAIERWLASRRAPDERPGEEVALLRRGVLAFDILVLAGLGYWIGSLVGA
jgi:hypothetical protein